MDRRTFVGFAAGATLVGNAEAMADDARSGLAGTGTIWTGAAALKGGKGYAPCPLGQLHYRQVGEGTATPILLIHQTPFGISEYVDIQPALAAGGRRSIVSDNPGYGMSDPLDGPVTIAGLADNLVALIDYLKVEKVIVAGHHTGAAFAAAFAARHSDRTAGVVLHGCPYYSQAEREERLSRSAEGPLLKTDGSHFSDSYTAIAKHAGSDPANTAGITWAVIGQYLSAAHSPVYKAVFSNDMSLDIAAIKAPALIMSDRHDSLHDNDQRVAAQRPDFTYREFTGDGSFALMHYPQKWADMVLTFARAHDL